MCKQLPGQRAFLCIASHHHAVRIRGTPPREGGREGGRDDKRGEGEKRTREGRREGRKEEGRAGGREGRKDAPIEELARWPGIKEAWRGKNNGRLEIIDIAHRTTVFNESEAEWVDKVHLGRDGGREGGRKEMGGRK